MRPGCVRAVSGAGVFRWAEPALGLLVGGVLLAAASSAAGANRIAVLPTAGAPSPWTVPLALPEDANIPVTLAEGDWTDVRLLQFTIDWPADAPTNAQVLVYMKDWDHFWYQHLLPGYLEPGEANNFSVDLTPAAAENWKGVGHNGAWHFRALQKPKLFGLRVFGPSAYAGACTLTNVWAMRQQDQEAPWIRGVRPAAEQVPCYGRFEVTFEVPDRYVDPFDADQVHVVATFRSPSGRTIPVDAYYGHDFFRQFEAVGETLVPQGKPYWRARFAPTEQGRYSYSLRITDRLGAADWGPGAFTATPPVEPGYIRVAKADPRFLEFTGGAPFFPVGHNIRSPNDVRMESNFPWLHRWHEGAASYERRFAKMEADGSNFAEVWSASWSLGLEWRGEWLGYRGVGQYNMMNAWEFDRVLEAAERHGIYINFVIHNHGKFSAFSDEEWADNPFNAAIGGFLTTPEQYFSDARAMACFRKLMRYMVSRWGYSTHLFSWQLWSELDLTGSKGDVWRSPDVVEWHRIMGREIKVMDPNDHLIGSHVCGDYSHQNPALISLKEMDYCPVDAYHNSSEALHIVTLMRQTADFNVPYRKPVLITEFGGTPMGQGLKHLVDSLHAALWSSTCIPVGGTPLLWWWHLVEEENLYPMYGAVQRFMRTVDRRNPALVVAAAAVQSPADALSVQCMSDGQAAHGWIYHGPRYETIDPAGPLVTSNAVLQIKGIEPGAYSAEFWDTHLGAPVATNLAEVAAGPIQIAVPAFARDVAFKLRPM